MDLQNSKKMVKRYITFFVFTLLVNFLYGQVNNNIEEEFIVYIEKSPFFKGDLREFIRNEIDYPLTAKADSIEGTVFISFWIDTLGTTYNHEVIRGIREDVDSEALRVAKLIKFDKPALQSGKPIKIRYTVPVEFKLISTTKKERRCKKGKR